MLFRKSVPILLGVLIILQIVSAFIFITPVMAIIGCLIVLISAIRWELRGGIYSATLCFLIVLILQLLEVFQSSEWLTIIITIILYYVLGIGIGGVIGKIRKQKLDLESSEERYSQLSEQSRVFTWAVDEQGLYTYIDHFAEVVLGYSSKEIVLKKHFYDLCPEEEREMLKQTAFEAFRRKEPFINLENKALTKNGHIVWFSTNGMPVLKDDGTLQGYNGTNTDITNRKQAELALKESEERYSSYIENAPDGVFISDENGKYLEVNRAASEITGYSNEELLNMAISDLLSEESLEDGMNQFKKLLKTGKSSGETLFKRKDGTKRWWSVNAIKLTEHRFMGFVKDITEQKNTEEKVLYLSYHDQLTGLYNRRFYEEELERLDTKRNLPLTIVMGDVNGLKLINDSLGHAMGDELLIAAAKVIEKACRADDIIVRFGGDEFVILLPKTDSLEAEQIIKRINELSINSKEGHLDISISFGYKTKYNQEEKIQDVFKRAEDMMYRNKISQSSATRIKTVDLVMKTLFKKYKREQSHSIRVSEICESIATKMGYKADDIDQMRIAGLLHDIGKVDIDGKILNKPQKLNEDEWGEMKRHPEKGYRILSLVDQFSEIAKHVYEHHERWDGTGYPRGLKGEEISLPARIITVADSYDAMTTDRSYAKALNKEEAINEIRRYSGTHFDPEIAALFVKMISTT